MKNHILKAQKKFQAAKNEYAAILTAEGEKIVGKDIFKKLLSAKTEQEKINMAYLVSDDEAMPDELFVLELLYENTLCNSDYLKGAIKDLS